MGEPIFKEKPMSREALLFLIEMCGFETIDKPGDPAIQYNNYEDSPPVISIQFHAKGKSFTYNSSVAGILIVNDPKNASTPFDKIKGKQELDEYVNPEKPYLVLRLPNKTTIPRDQTSTGTVIIENEKRSRYEIYFPVQLDQVDNFKIYEPEE